ncbi:MAG TPA: glycosyltransferase [Acidimicrobiia bacterium]|nr:glycosyltransferase [Acidimicrobiia bacterium]
MAWVGLATIAYFILMQAYLIVLAVISGSVLRRNHHLLRFNRGSAMLSTATAPPLSIVIAAYNEEAGIVDAVRSMSIVKYPRFEIIVTNDGSRDHTLEALIGAFHLERVRVPYRPDLDCEPIRAIYRGRSGVDITVIDKLNGGRADALNAGINAARHPYVFCTDADVVLEPDCLVHAMRRVVDDRDRTVCVGGNIRPLNGSRIELGHLIAATVPRRLVPRMQVLEYVRTFLASRPAWSTLNALPLVSGAFGIWKKSVVLDVGGFTRGHMGEDLDLTMRVHRLLRDRGEEYRIVYEPSAVVWTEVPENLRVLRRQRIRWHLGLMTAMNDFRGMILNPRYGSLGMSWTGFFFFEYLAPIIEVIGWFVIPTAWLLGALSTTALSWMMALAVGVGLANSLIALLLDESYGYFNSPGDTSRLVAMALLENFGLRQLTVLWRIKALLAGNTNRPWGNMERRGVANLADRARPV